MNNSEQNDAAFFSLCKLSSLRIPYCKSRSQLLCDMDHLIDGDMDGGIGMQRDKDRQGEME